VLAGSFLATWGLCELIARVRWLRPCFGMKPARVRNPARVAPEPVEGQSVHTV
jgi:glucans biosynthesis protein C